MKLNNIQLDALKELGNIGAGHAATALSQLIKREIHIQVPVSCVVKKEQIISSFPSKADFIAVEFMILGEITGKNLFFIEMQEGFRLVDRIMGRADSPTAELNDTVISTLQEVGNILTANYLGSMGDMLNLLMIPSVPSLYSGKTDEIIRNSIEKDPQSSEEILIIKTNLVDAKMEFNPFFMLVPFENGMNMIFNKLGLV